MSVWVSVISDPGGSGEGTNVRCTCGIPTPPHGCCRRIISGNIACAREKGLGCSQAALRALVLFQRPSVIAPRICLVYERMQPSGASRCFGELTSTMRPNELASRRNGAWADLGFRVSAPDSAPRGDLARGVAEVPVVRVDSVAAHDGCACGVKGERG